MVLSASHIRPHLAKAVTGCLVDTSFDIAVHGPSRVPIAALGPLRFCEGDSVRLEAGAGFVSYAWSDGGSDRALMVKKSGTYFVTGVDSNGCVGVSDTVRIFVDAASQARIEGPREVCQPSIAVFAVGDSDLTAIRWTVEGGSIVTDSTLSTISVRWDSRSAGVVRVFARKGTCAIADSVQVTVRAALHPVIVADNGYSICTGDSAHLSTDAQYAEYAWYDSSGATMGNTREISVRDPGRYSVTVRDAAGCEGRATVTMTLRPSPSPVVTGPDSLCVGEAARLFAGGGFVRYEWRDIAGNPLGSDTVFMARTSGVYTVSVTDSNGCRGTSPPHAVQFLPLPATPSISRSGDSLRSSAAFSYQWYLDSVAIPGEHEQLCIARNDGRYSVRVMNASGCAAWSPAREWRKPRSTATIGLPFLEASPGDTVTIPVSLLASSALAEAGAPGFTGTMRFNNTLLAPIHGTAEGVVDARDRLVSFQRRYEGTGDRLHALVFLAMLGDTDRTVLHLERFAWTGAAVTVTGVDGEFRLKICREGGARLFDGAATLYLGQNRPNPFNAQTEIEYGLIETGPVRLSVLDLLGREVALLVDASMTPGRYRTLFDASRLSSGVYFTVLRTPSGSLVRAMQLAK